MNERCCTKVTDSKVKLEEKGKCLVVLNDARKEITKIQVDNCLIVDGIRADKAVFDENHFIIVELKGSNVDHACKQVLATAANDRVRTLIGKRKLGLAIICSQYPRDTTGVQKARNRAAEMFKAPLKVACTKCEARLADLVTL